MAAQKPSKPRRAMEPEMVLYVASTEVLELDKDGLSRPKQRKGDKLGILTVGIGRAFQQGSPEHERFKNGITRAQAQALFAEDLAEHCEWIQDDAQVELNKYEYSALGSAGYNLGKRWLVSLGSKANKLVTTLCLKLRAGKKIEAFLLLYQFCNNTDRKYLDGLFYRRIVETYYGLAGKLVLGVDTCTEVLQLINDIERVVGPAYAKNVKEIRDFFARKHVKALCPVCKRKK